MTKIEFLAKIRSGLSTLSEDERQKTHEFYREMIDDMIEDGLTEAEAVSKVGDPDEIIKNILADATHTKASPEPKPQTPKKSNPGLTAAAIILIILGSPLWLSLIIAAFSVVIAIVATIISIVISLYATVLGLAIGAIILFIMAILGTSAKGLLCFGGALICAGLTVLLFFATNLIAKFLFFICKSMFKGIKSLFTRRKTA